MGYIKINHPVVSINNRIKKNKMKKIFLTAAALLMITSLTLNAQEPKKEAKAEKKEEHKEVKAEKKEAKAEKKEEHKEAKAEKKEEHKDKGEHKGEAKH